MNTRLSRSGRRYCAEAPRSFSSIVPWHPWRQSALVSLLAGRRHALIRPCSLGRPRQGLSVRVAASWGLRRWIRERPGGRVGSDREGVWLPCHHGTASLAPRSRPQDFKLTHYPRVRPVLVELETIRVRVPNHVQPLRCPALAVMRRLEQSIDDFSYASRVWSFRNESSSPGVGGSPVRS